MAVLAAEAGELIGGRIAARVGAQLAERAAVQVAERTAVQVAERAAVQAGERAAVRAGERAGKRAAVRAGERGAVRAGERAAVKAVEEEAEGNVLQQMLPNALQMLPMGGQGADYDNDNDDKRPLISSQNNDNQKSLGGGARFVDDNDDEFDQKLSGAAGQSDSLLDKGLAMMGTSWFQSSLSALGMDPHTFDSVIPGYATAFHLSDLKFATILCCIVVGFLLGDVLAAPLCILIEFIESAVNGVKNFFSGNLFGIG